MLSLMKQHVLINSSVSHFIIALIIAAAYLVAIPPTFLFTVTILSLPVILFFYDDKNNLNRFIISLPIAKQTIIRSRYLYIAIMSLVILLFQWLIMISFSSMSDALRYIYDWRDIIVLFCMACLIIAICIPIYYAIKSFPVATGIIMTLWFIGSFFILFFLILMLEMEEFIIFNDLDPGFVLLVEKYIPFQPYVILIIASLVIFYFSIKVSEHLFIKRDR